MNSATVSFSKHISKKSPQNIIGLHYTGQSSGTPMPIQKVHVAANLLRTMSFAIDTLGDRMWLEYIVNTGLAW